MLSTAWHTQGGILGLKASFSTKKRIQVRLLPAGWVPLLA